MAQDFTKGNGTEVAWSGPRGWSMQRITIDFSKTTASSAEVLAIFNVPKNTLVSRIAAICHRAEGGAANVDVGDGSDVDGFLVDFNVNSVASSLSSLALTEGTPNTITGYSGGKYYTAADTIDIIPSADLDYAIVSFVVEMHCFDVTL
jgi:hypothetical protein